jgi:hypothetical protein
MGSVIVVVGWAVEKEGRGRSSMGEMGQKRHEKGEGNGSDSKTERADGNKKVIP